MTTVFDSKENAAHIYFRCLRCKNCHWRCVYRLSPNEKTMFMIHKMTTKLFQNGTSTSLCCRDCDGDLDEACFVCKTTNDCSHVQIFEGYDELLRLSV